jgi:hypothetical protein
LIIILAGRELAPSTPVFPLARLGDDDDTNDAPLVACNGEDVLFNNISFSLRLSWSGAKYEIADCLFKFLGVVELRDCGGDCAALGPAPDADDADAAVINSLPKGLGGTTGLFVADNDDRVGDKIDWLAVVGLPLFWTTDPARSRR